MVGADGGVGQRVDAGADRGAELVDEHLEAEEVVAVGPFAGVVAERQGLAEGELETLGLVLDAGRQPGLMVEGWYRRWVVTPDGEDSCSVSIDFCDCAC